MKNMKLYAVPIAVLIIIILGGGWLFLATIGEIDNPTIKLGEHIRPIGRQKVIQITFGDTGRGLRNISITIEQDKKPRVVTASVFPQKGTKQKILNLTVDPVPLKLHDGPALLSITATDFSLWKNKATLARNVNVDFNPPQISLITPTNNINPGGTCVIAFRTSEVG